jgi:acyl transferase domain-containing protein
MSVEAAVEATMLRCEAIAAADRPGAMASVFGTREQVRQLLDGLPGYAAESNLNSPDQTVVSGEPAAIEALIERAQKQGITAVRLSVPRAFHSELMRPARLLLERRLHEIDCRILPCDSSRPSVPSNAKARLNCVAGSSSN